MENLNVSPNLSPDPKMPPNPPTPLVPPSTLVTSIPPTSPKNHQSKKLISILALLLVIVIGAGAYFLYSQKSGTQPRLVDQSPVTVSGPKYVLAYSAQDYDYATGKWSNSRVAVYDSENNTNTVIQNLDSGAEATITANLLGTNSAYPPKTFFYILQDLTKGWARLVKVDLEGNVIFTVPDYKGAEYFSGQITVSQDGQKLAWCQEGAIKVYDDATKNVRTYSIDPICGLGTGNLTFSRNKNSLYFARSFYELNYDDAETYPTREELSQMAKEGKHGYHELDLETGLSKMFVDFSSNPMALSFWNDEIFNLDNGIMLLKNWDQNTTITTIEIKKLNKTDFDYLTKEEIQNLPTISKISFPDKEIGQASLSAEGDGFVYMARLAADVRSPSELGFYDINSNQNYLPIPNTAHYGGRFINHLRAINKNFIFYTESEEIRKTGSVDYRTHQYKTDFLGNNEPFDFGPFRTLDFVKK